MYFTKQNFTPYQINETSVIMQASNVDTYSESGQYVSASSDSNTDNCAETKPDKKKKSAVMH